MPSRRGVRGRGVSPRPPLLCGPVGGRAAPCGLLIAETPGWRRGAGSAPAAAPRVCVRLALRGEPLPVEVVYRLLVSVIDVLAAVPDEAFADAVRDGIDRLLLVPPSRNGHPRY